LCCVVCLLLPAGFTQFHQVHKQEGGLHEFFRLPPTIPYEGSQGSASVAVIRAGCSLQLHAIHAQSSARLPADDKTSKVEQNVTGLCETYAAAFLLVKYKC
jgi:hypothetical protein